MKTALTTAAAALSLGLGIGCGQALVGGNGGLPPPAPRRCPVR
jgi:hypothetical protein